MEIRGLDFEGFNKLSTKDITENFTAHLIQSDSNPDLDYKVYVPKKNLVDQKSICFCPAGQNNRPCKHTFRAEKKVEFMDAWWLWKQMGKNPNDLWNKCLLWASNDQRVVSKKHLIKNEAITKFLKYVGDKAAEWSADKLKVIDQNKKFCLTMFEGRLTEHKFEEIWNNCVKTFGLYQTQNVFSNIKHVVEHIKKALNEPNDLDAKF